MPSGGVLFVEMTACAMMICRQRSRLVTVAQPYLHPLPESLCIARISSIANFTIEPDRIAAPFTPAPAHVVLMDIGRVRCEHGASPRPWLFVLQPFSNGFQVDAEFTPDRKLAPANARHAPAARTVVRLMALERNNLTKAQTMTVAAIEGRLPDLVEARDVVESFHDMLRRKSSGDLEAWIERAAKSLVASFANGVTRDRAAIQNAITSQWSNGQTEGQITKLKLIKRHVWTASALQAESFVA